MTLPLLLNARGAMRGVKKNTSKGKINEREESKSFKEQFQALVASKRKTPAGTEKHIRACKMSRSSFHCWATYPFVLCWVRRGQKPLAQWTCFT